jgi:hypothetical protein
VTDCVHWPIQILKWISTYTEATEACPTSPRVVQFPLSVVWPFPSHLRYGPFRLVHIGQRGWRGIHQYAKREREREREGEELNTVIPTIHGTSFRRLNIPNPVNRPCRLWDVEARTSSRQSAHRWGWGCQPYAPVALYIPGRFLVLISVRGWVDHRAIVRLEGLGQLKNQMTSRIEPATLKQ